MKNDVFFQYADGKVSRQYRDDYLIILNELDKEYLGIKEL